MKEFRKLIAAIAFAHAAAILGMWLWWDPNWLALSFVAYVGFLWLGHDLYYHRFLSHRSFDMPGWLQRVCCLLGVYCLFGTPIGIASTHVRHHRYADTEDDPHPAHHPWRAWFWLHPGMQKRDRATLVRLSKEPWLRFVGRHYFTIYFATVLAAFLIDPKIAVYGFFVPATYGYFSNGLINVVCHRRGYKRYGTNSNARNNLFVNALLFFGGIALHNTHHAKPKDYQLSRAWYEVDLVGCLAHLIHIRTNRGL